MGKETVCQTIPPGAVDIHFSEQFIPFGTTILPVRSQSLRGRLARPDEARARVLGNRAPKAMAADSDARWRDRCQRSDPDGGQDIAEIYFLLNSALDPVNSCLVRYQRNSSSLWLAQDSGSTWIGPLKAGSQTFAATTSASCRDGLFRIRFGGELSVRAGCGYQFRKALHYSFTCWLWTTPGPIATGRRSAGLRVKARGWLQPAACSSIAGPAPVHKRL